MPKNTFLAIFVMIPPFDSKLRIYKKKVTICFLKPSKFFPQQFKFKM